MSQSVSSFLLVANPYLVNGHYLLTRYDMAATDIIRDPIFSGRFAVDLTSLPRIYDGTIQIITPNAALPGFFWAAGNDRVAYLDGREGRWEELTRLPVPYAPAWSDEQINAVVLRTYASLDELASTVEEAWGGYERTLRMPNSILARLCTFVLSSTPHKPVARLVHEALKRHRGVNGL